MKWLKPAFAKGKMSYAQCGEDLIIDFALTQLGITLPSYLDLGANDPVSMNNTFLFYKKGARGVCVEPDPTLGERLRRVRPKDRHLTAGVGKGGGTATFYIMTNPALNTFSKDEAVQIETYGNHKIESTLELPIIGINQILSQNFTKELNYASIDVEGLDLAILTTWDFSRYRPQIMCIETLSYAEDGSEHKIKEISGLMSQNGYFTYADTYINTIFVEEKGWGAR